jgi:hypothetical protein
MEPLKSDFRNFLWLVWNYLNLPEPFPVQYEIAQYLQHGPKRLIIQAFRGVGKSWITSAFVCWLLLCDPQLNILVVSASKQRADDFSTFTMRLIMEMEELEHLRPREGQRSSKIAFDVAPAQADHAPSVKSAGITGQITGSRADVIVGDDVEIANNSETVTMREKLMEKVKEFDSIIKPGGRIVFLGTPQTEESIYNGLPSIFECRIWPGRYPSPKILAKYGSKLAPSIAKAVTENPALAGHSTAPVRFSDEDLQEREDSIGRSTFALQFMLDTTMADADRYPLKLSDLIVFDCDKEKGPFDMAWGSSPAQAILELPNIGFSGDRYHKPIFIDDRWSPYEGIIMSIDPSGRGGDEVGYAIVAMLHSRLYVLDAGGLAGGYADGNLQALSAIARRHKVHKIIVEPNFGDGMFNKLLAPVLNAVWPCAIEDTERSNAQKERRIIDCLEPVMNQHRLVFDKALIQRDYDSTLDRPAEQQNVYRLLYQLTRITKDRGSLRKDDRVDALALAVHYWTSIMAEDTVKAAQNHRDRLLDEDIERYFSGDGPMTLIRSSQGGTAWGRSL